MIDWFGWKTKKKLDHSMDLFEDSVSLVFQAALLLVTKKKLAKAPKLTPWKIELGMTCVTHPLFECKFY
jgi:hypothetical protein